MYLKCRNRVQLGMGRSRHKIGGRDDSGEEHAVMNSPHHLAHNGGEELTHVLWTFQGGGPQYHQVPPLDFFALLNICKPFKHR